MESKQTYGFPSLNEKSKQGNDLFSIYYVFDNHNEGRSKKMRNYSIIVFENILT